MNSTLTYTLIVIGLIAIVLLGLQIRRQLRRQRELKLAQQTRELELREQAREHRQYLVDSVRLVAAAVLNDEKMTLTEGCIRLKVLLDNLAPHLLQHQDFVVIERVYEATRHIPFLAEWKALSKVEQARYQLQMVQVEAEHVDAAEHAMRALQRYPLEQLQ